MMPRLVLLDRDGTLNRKAPEGAYVTEPAALEILPGAADAVRRLNEAGIPIAVVTNQRCVALGLVSEPMLERIHARLQDLLAAAGAHVDAIYHCPHHARPCDCHKPEPGLLAAAAADFGVAPVDTVMIGDADSDVEAGRRFGARTIHLTTGSSESGETACNLAAAANLILAR
jgi:D-glycero-D-manno-heptose 1,7-bisphosphate phosphatase